MMNNSKKSTALKSKSSASSSSNKKRDREAEDDGDVTFTPEELARMSRSERKRHREKKRRSDVNKGFDDLMTLLLEIDPVVRAEAEDRARRGQWKGNLGAHEDNLLSRVDLISRTVEVLRKIHQENEQRKQVIEQLVRGGSMLHGSGAAAGFGGEASLLGTSLPGATTDMSSLFSASSALRSNTAALQGSSLAAAGLLGQQARLSGALPVGSSDLLGLGGAPAPAGLSALSGLSAAPAGAATGLLGASGANAVGLDPRYGSALSRAELLEQLAKEKETAAAIARARASLQGSHPF